MDLQNELLASGKRNRTGGLKATLASLGLHGGLIAFILFMSAQAAEKVAAEDKPIHAFLSSKAAPPKNPRLHRPRLLLHPRLNRKKRKVPFASAATSRRLSPSIAPNPTTRTPRAKHTSTAWWSLKRSSTSKAKLSRSRS